jgi:hypothetical protein
LFVLVAEARHTAHPDYQQQNGGPDRGDEPYEDHGVGGYLIDHCPPIVGATTRAVVISV